MGLHIIGFERRRNTDGVKFLEGGSMHFVVFKPEVDDQRCAKIKSDLAGAIKNSPGKKGDLNLICLFDGNPIKGAQIHDIDNDDYNANQLRIIEVFKSWM